MTKLTKTIRQKIGEWLTGDAPGSSADVKEAIAAIETRLAEIKIEIRDRLEPNPLHGPGRVYLDALAKPGPEALVNIEKDRQMLEAERRQLEQQRSLLQKKLEHCRGAELAAATPAAIKELAAALDKWAAAQHAAAQAKQAAQNARSAITLGRRAMDEKQRARDRVPEKVIRRLQRAMGWKEPADPWRVHDGIDQLWRDLRGEPSPKKRADKNPKALRAAAAEKRAKSRAPSEFWAGR